MTRATRTYLDSSVLIAAAHGVEAAHVAAMSVFTDPRREYIASEFIRMETEAIARYSKQAGEVDFYEEYLRSVSLIVDMTSALVARGIAYVEQFGVLGMDALHLAAAELGEADEFVTAEKPTRPFFRVTGARFQIVGIHP